MIAYKILTEYFWKSNGKLLCGNVVNMPKFSDWHNFHAVFCRMCTMCHHQYLDRCISSHSYRRDYIDRGPHIVTLWLILHKCQLWQIRVTSNVAVVWAQYPCLIITTATARYYRLLPSHACYQGIFMCYIGEWQKIKHCRCRNAQKRYRPITWATDHSIYI